MGTNGATPLTRHEAQRRARSILESEDYQTSLKERIRDKQLPPAVETMLWYYAFGKPMEQVQINVSQQEEDLSTLGTAELLRRAQELAKLLEQAEALDAAIPAEYKVG